jgi:hypothetical protein
MWGASSAMAATFVIPVTSSTGERVIPAHGGGETTVPGHGASGTSAVPGWSWNYTGNHADARYPAYMSAFNSIYMCIGPTPLPDLYNCDSDDNLPPGGNDYSGYEYVYFTFELPANASNVLLWIGDQNADDRHVFSLNGQDFGVFKPVGPGNPDQSATVTMTGAGGSTVFNVIRNSQNGLLVTNQGAFNIGGSNYVRVWINNTGYPDPRDGSAVPHSIGGPSGFNLWGYVTYDTPGVVAEPTPVPVLTPLGLGLGSLLIGGVGALVSRRRSGRGA